VNRSNNGLPGFTVTCGNKPDSSDVIEILFKISITI